MDIVVENDEKDKTRFYTPSHPPMLPNTYCLILSAYAIQNNHKLINIMHIEILQVDSIAIANRCANICCVPVIKDSHPDAHMPKTTPVQVDLTVLLRGTASLVQPLRSLSTFKYTTYIHSGLGFNSSNAMFLNPMGEERGHRSWRLVYTMTRGLNHLGFRQL